MPLLPVVEEAPPTAGDDEDDASADVVGCGEGGAGDDAF